MNRPARPQATQRLRPLLMALLATLTLVATWPSPATAAPSRGARPAGSQVAASAKARAPVTSQTQTSRQARREAMRLARIPTSQQPVKQIYTRAGRQLHYELPRPGGGRKPMVVTHQTTDRVPGHGRHWEAGPAKQPVRTDPLGRTRVSNDKAKVNHAH